MNLEASMTISANAPTITEATIRSLSQSKGEPSWLLEKRLEALRAFEAMAMPNPLEEEWRRTDLSRIDFDVALAGTGDGSSELRSESLPAGVVFSDLATAAREHEALVKEHLHSLAAAERVEARGAAGRCLG